MDLILYPSLELSLGNDQPVSHTHRRETFFVHQLIGRRWRHAQELRHHFRIQKQRQFVIAFENRFLQYFTPFHYISLRFPKFRETKRPIHLWRIFRQMYESTLLRSEPHVHRRKKRYSVAVRFPSSCIYFIMENQLVSSTLQGPFLLIFVYSKIIFFGHQNSRHQSQTKIWTNLDLSL